MAINEVILSGRIEKINYGLVDKGKVYSLAIIKLKFERNQSPIKILFKNELADSVYKKNKVGDIIVISGSLRIAKKEAYIFADNITLLKNVEKIRITKCLNPLLLDEKKISKFDIKNKKSINNKYCKIKRYKK